MSEQFKLADVDGVLCVVEITADWTEPRLIAHHWPTVARTARALDVFDVKAIGELAAVRSSLPGEFFIGRRDECGQRWASGQHVRLVDGQFTQPIKTDFLVVVRPRVRAGTVLYWSDGRWVKHTSRGVERLEPVAVSS